MCWRVTFFMYPIKMRTMECIGFFTTHILYFVAGGFRVVC